MQISYYKIFALGIELGNKIKPKVRLSDYSFAGTGIETPATSVCEFTVSGLEPDHIYMFALAAYTIEGRIVGGGIGESTRPILAAHPPSVLMMYTYLVQVC